MNEKLPPATNPPPSSSEMTDYRFEPSYTTSSAKHSSGTSGLYPYITAAEAKRKPMETSTDIGGRLKTNGKNDASQSSTCCNCFSASRADRDQRKRTAIAVSHALIVNFGVCTLLLAYIFIGSFAFLTIENSAEEAAQLEAKSYASSSIAMATATTEWQVTPIATSQQQQHEQQQQKLKPSGAPLYNSGTFNSSLLGGSATPEEQTRPYMGDMHGKLSHDATAFASNRANTDYEEQSVSLVAGDDEMELEDAARQRTVENIWDITVSLNILYKDNWTRLASLEIAKFQNQLVNRLVMDVMLSATGNKAQSASGNQPQNEKIKATITQGRRYSGRQQPP